MKRLSLALMFSVMAFGVSAVPAMAAAPSFRCNADSTGEYLGIHAPGADGWAGFLEECRAYGQVGGKPGLPVRAD